MEINGLTGAQIRPTPRVLAENVAPTMTQALVPQDSLSLQSRGKPSGGPSANTRLSDLKPEQLKALGGGASVESIAKAQPGTTVGELGPLLRNPEALDSIAGLMQHRNDLKIGDFVSQDQQGRVRIDPSYKDPQTMELLKERDNVTPSEISAMRQNFAKTLKNPDLARMATQKSFELLKKRPDLSPEDLGKMMDTFKGAAGGDQKGQKGGEGDGEAGGMAALQMFDSASKLMTERQDVDPKRVGEMARSVGELSSPEDKNGPSLVAEGFESASKSLQENPLRQPEDMSKLASTLGEHMAGQDEGSAGHRMNAFKQTSEMLGSNPMMDHTNVDKMMTQATERDPRIQKGEGGGSTKRLASVVNDVTTGVKQGTVPSSDLSAHFRNQDAERARFQNENPEQKKAENQSQQSEDGGSRSSDPESPSASRDSASPGQERGESSGNQRGLDPFARAASLPTTAPGEAPGVKSEVAARLGPGEAAGTGATEGSTGTRSTSGAASSEPQTSAAGGGIQVESERRG